VNGAVARTRRAANKIATNSELIQKRKTSGNVMRKHTRLWWRYFILAWCLIFSCAL